MGEVNLHTIPDGEPLATLTSGLVIVRRRKHEWVAGLEDADRQTLYRLTSKVKGSKFAKRWTLQAYVTWLSQQLELLGWTNTTPSQDVTIDMGETVGYSKGIAVTKIRIELSSRMVHAYPVEA